MAESRTLSIDGVSLTLLVERRRVKNINARLHGTEMRVSAPLALPAAELDRIIADLARRLLRRVRTKELNADGSAAELARRVAARFPEPPAVHAVRFAATQRARWGSYSPATGVVRLNVALRAMPAWVLEAVLAHELAHVTHPDHGPAFWALVRRACPDSDRARAFLAGVSWLASRWPSLAPHERSVLAGDVDEP